MSTLTAARLQMTVSLMFHMVFAAIGIGLPLLLVVAEGLYLRTRKGRYLVLARKWAKATGLLFAVGAVSGTALSFELGLLWPKYMEVMGAVVGHAFALEGFAFFIEAIFIGLYLYGWDKLKPVQHWLCGVAIAVSGAASGILVLGVNAWMQLPVGFDAELYRRTGEVLATDPVAIYKRYAWFVMALHSTLACYAAVAFAVAAVYAAGWLKGRRDEYHRSALRIAMAVGAVSAVAQPVAGDLLAKFVFQTQPAKFAAMEAHFETGGYAPVQLGGIADEEKGEVKYAIRIPWLLSVLADHKPGTVVVGLKDIPRELWPPVVLTHLAFDVMVGLGMWMMVLAVWFWWVEWRGRKHREEGVRAARWGRGLLWATALSGPAGFVALEAGWVVTEVGRQPWVIQGVMKTAEAVTPAAGVPMLFYSFCVLYAVLGVAVVVFLRYLAKPTEKGLFVAPQESAV